MSKVIIEFNLPEENEDYKIVTSSASMHSVIWDLSQRLRNILEYQIEGFDIETVQALNDELWDMIEENNIRDLF